MNYDNGIGTGDNGRSKNFAGVRDAFIHAAERDQREADRGIASIEHQYHERFFIFVEPAPAPDGRVPVFCDLMGLFNFAGRHRLGDSQNLDRVVFCVGPRKVCLFHRRAMKPDRPAGWQGKKCPR